jgi:hypothetical protein
MEALTDKNGSAISTPAIAWKDTMAHADQDTEVDVPEYRDRFPGIRDLS